MPNKSTKHSVNNTPIISVKDLTVSFNQLAVLRDINFDIDAKEVVAIIGPNGSGKTTLLKALIGLLPYDGDIKIYGKNSRLALPKIGYVPQRFSFDKTFPLTAEELLKLSQKKPNAKKLTHALKEVEMVDQRHKQIGQLSGGQIQRLLIAQAIINEPEILFLDEPTAGIDVEGEKGFYDLVKHQNEVHGVTIILVSHEVNIVYKYATKVICVNQDLVCFGGPKEAITPETMKKLFGEDVAFPHHHHHA
jgi:ABC-type Mn2+/Zn2+ transport system ATPase subunit